jgi:hypothetical protein
VSTGVTHCAHAGSQSIVIIMVAELCNIIYTRRQSGYVLLQLLSRQVWGWGGSAPNIFAQMHCISFIGTR